MIQKITDSATQKTLQSPCSSAGSWDGLLPSQSTPQMGEFICAVQVTDRDSKLVFSPVPLQTIAYQCNSPGFHRKVCGNYLRRNVYYRIIDYPELERTHKDYQLQLVAPYSIAQNPNPVYESAAQMPLELQHSGPCLVLLTLCHPQLHSVQEVRPHRAEQDNPSLHPEATLGLMLPRVRLAL